MRLRWLLFCTFALASVACGEPPDKDSDNDDASTNAATNNQTTDGNENDRNNGPAPSCDELHARICDEAAPCADDQGNFIVALGDMATIEYESIDQCGTLAPVNQDKCETMTGDTIRATCANELDAVSCDGNTLTLPDVCYDFVFQD